MKYKLELYFETDKAVLKVFDQFIADDTCVQGILRDLSDCSVIDGFRDCKKYPLPKTEYRDELVDIRLRH